MENTANPNPQADIKELLTPVYNILAGSVNKPQMAKQSLLREKSNS